MGVKELWQSNKRFLLLSAIAITLLIVSFMLSIVRIGLIVIAISILVYIVVSIIQKKKKKPNDAS